MTFPGTVGGVRLRKYEQVVVATFAGLARSYALRSMVWLPSPVPIVSQSLGAQPTFCPSTQTSMRSRPAAASVALTSMRTEPALEGEGGTTECESMEGLV